MPNDLSLSQAVSELKGVGPKMQEKLARLKLHKVSDLLFHLPLRYQDRTRLHAIGGLKASQEVLVEGTVEHSEILIRRRRMMICQIADGTGILTLRFFYFANAQKDALSRGTRVRCFGEVRNGLNSLEMVHPEYRLLKNTDEAIEDSLTPIYPLTEGLQQRSLKRLIQLALKHTDQLRELLPSSVLQNTTLPSLAEALHTLHSPASDDDLTLLLETKHPAQIRLSFEELLAQHLSLARFKQQSTQLKGHSLSISGKYYQPWLQSLPFSPTQAQQRVMREISKDLKKNHPMARLVQGDVGSGKTFVAAASALYAIENDLQVALMAPTELLAEQHFQNFQTWFEPLGLDVTWLSGRQTAKERRRQVENLLLGISHIAIGTHALFQQDIQFQQLGLIIIDEQHRFGVQQRLALREKGKQAGFYPHQLIMTATPIPRTLAMTGYADLEYSVIDELPPGRQPIKTVAPSNERRPEIIERVRTACLEGRQAYWVCTLIEESESLQCQAAEDTWKLLQENLPELKIGLIHGRMASDEKEDIMASFKAAELQLLVATTVIEVGVDVPAASLMIIENAERLGLAQLHQLRGRVGRGSVASSCVLMYQSPLSKNGRTRLDTLRNSNDGFEIAQVDLELRGPGEVLGTRQTGEMQLKIADLIRDQHLIPHVQQAAEHIMQKQPELIEPLINRWLGEKAHYGNV